MTQPQPYNAENMSRWYLKFVIDLTFFMLIKMFILNIIFGVIVDTFACNIYSPPTYKRIEGRKREKGRRHELGVFHLWSRKGDGNILF